MLNQSSSASLESQKDSGGKSGGTSARSGESCGGREWLSVVVLEAAAMVSQAILRSQEPPAQAETRVSRSTCGIVRNKKEKVCLQYFERERERDCRVIGGGRRL